MSLMPLFPELILHHVFRSDVHYDALTDSLIAMTHRYLPMIHQDIYLIFFISDILQNEDCLFPLNIHFQGQGFHWKGIKMTERNI